MFDLKKQCTLVALSPEQRIIDFDCGNADLNDFFNQDAILYQEQLLGQTYFFKQNSTKQIVCAFTWSPDGFKTSMLPNSRRQKQFPNLIRFLLVDAYNEPAVLNFYQKNDFLFVFSSEAQEWEYYKKSNTGEPLQTRYMFYDMIQWRNKLYDS